MDKKQIIHISTVLCYNSNDKHRPRRILGFAGLQSGTTWSGFTSIEFWWLKWKTSEIEESGLRNFDDFVIKYLLFSHQNTFCSPSDTIFEIENLVLNKRNESNLGMEVVCAMLNVSQNCLKQKMFVMKLWNYWNESIEKQNSILSSGKYYFTVIFCNFHNMNLYKLSLCPSER